MNAMKMKTSFEKFFPYLSGLRFWIIMASVVIVLAAMKESRYIINVILLAFFATSISIAPIAWMKKKGIPEMFANLIMVFVFIIMVGLTILIISSSVNNFVSRVPFYNEKFNELWSNTHDWLVQHNLVEEDFSPLKELSPGNVINMAGGLFASIGNVVGSFFLVFIIYIFMLFEISVFSRKLKLINPRSVSSVDNVLRNLVKYFGIKTLTSLATGLSIAFMLFLFGVDFPILWGFLAFILNFIPSVGSFLAAIPAVLLSLILLGPGSALFIAVGYLVINTIIGNVIEPNLMGRNLGISPLFVFIAMIFWGFILGAVGMLIATPLIIMIKIILDSRPVSKDLGTLLGNSITVKALEDDKKKQDIM